jgi:hypothetical protein
MRNDSKLRGVAAGAQDDLARSESDPLELPLFERAVRFRQYAEEATFWAEKASSENKKAACLKLAAEWSQLAEKLYRLGPN